MSEFQIAIENFLLIEPPVVAEEKKDTKTNNSNSMMPNSLGALSENFSSPNNDNGKFYITTAIAYTNGLPHIGHAYEFLSADVLARFHRLFGENTYFLTGSDEHGQKVANSAEKAGKAPIDHCNFYVEAFQHLNKRLVVSNNKYIRTTDSIHKETAQKLWTICAANDDIYLDKYEGWYNEREENFVTDADAEANNFIDPGNGIPLKRVSLVELLQSYSFLISLLSLLLFSRLSKKVTFSE